MEKRKLNFSLIEIFILFSYFICWVSISTSLYDISNFYLKENLSSKEIVNFLRQSFNIIIFPILLIIILKEFKHIVFKNELLFIFAFIYFFLQIPGLILTNNSLMNIGYIISSFNILFIFILANIFFNQKKYLNFIYITLFMLLLITVLNYKTIVNFFTNSDSSVMYSFFYSSETFFGKESPRSTGSSRTFLIIFIISNLIFYEFFKKRNFIKIIFYILISTIILLFQSRTTTTLLVVYIFANYYYEENFSIKGLFKYTIIYFIMPIIFLYSVLVIKQFFHNKDFSLFNNKNKNISKSLIQITDDFKRPIDTNTYSSGRINDWKSLLSKINNSLVFGYGAQGDRYLINQTASNGMIYAITSSGIFGLISFIFFSINSLWIVLRNFLYIDKQEFKKSFYSSLIVLLLLLRSILESSYAVFSVDFIVIYTFISYLKIFSLLKKNGN